MWQDSNVLIINSMRILFVVTPGFKAGVNDGLVCKWLIVNEFARGVPLTLSEGGHKLNY